MLYLYIYIDSPLNNLKNSRTVLAISIASMLLFSGTNAFAEIGTGPPNESPGFGTSSLTLNDNGDGATFSGNGGYSADGLGTLASSGLIQAEIPAGSTVVSAYLYATTQSDSTPATVTVELDDVSYILAETPFNTYDGCCELESFKYTGADLTAQVAAKYASDGPGVFDFKVEEISPGPFTTDGVALVVIYSNPGLPFKTIAVMDGSLATAGEETLIGLAEPLDKTIPGFEATLALGIGFSYQGNPPGSHICGGGQFSTVDINGVNLTPCAGHMDDGDVVSDGALNTVGGVGDNTANPPTDGEDDELYNLEPLLASGITVIDMDTANTSANDLIFLLILAITAQASVGEICGDGIDNDDDGQIDEGCTVDGDVVGGEFLPIDSTSLLIAGFQSSAIWMLPALAGIAGTGAYYIRARMNKD